VKKALKTDSKSPACAARDLRFISIPRFKARIGAVSRRVGARDGTASERLPS
jgi:hypothetical protein